MTTTVILEIDQVSHQFAQTTHPAVDQVSLTLDHGEILGLLGPSGCGKTTLLRLIAGFESPHTGSISLAGRTVAGNGQWVPPEQRGIGMVFQDYALFPHLTVAANVGFGLQASPKSRSPKTLPNVLQKTVAEAIALVGLSGFEHRYPHELSGGQQQRVALARALAPRPTLIVLDEPLSNLDVQVRLYLRREVRDILKATGTSAVFVTHDQEEALSIADRVAVMCQGKIEQLGSPETIYRQPASRFVAEFVTQANFLPAQRQHSHWQTEIGAFPLGDRDLPPEGATGVLMMRQEEMTLTLDANGPLLVRDRQFLGRDYCYQLQTASGQFLQARTNASFAPGDRVSLMIPAEPLPWFADAGFWTKPFSTPLNCQV
ncbi:MAG TPA: ABC transporter ATP-binding protein [Chroococcidiopsis sp.]